MKNASNSLLKEYLRLCDQDFNRMDKAAFIREQKVLEKLIEKIQKIQPDIVAYSAKTGEHKYYLQTNSLIKKNFPKIFS